MFQNPKLFFTYFNNRMFLTLKYLYFMMSRDASKLPKLVDKQDRNKMNGPLSSERDDYLNLHILTWNVAGIIPALHDIQSLFLPQETMEMMDICNNTDILVIGLQEAYPNVQDVVTAAVPLVGRDPLVDNFSVVLSKNGFSRVTSCRILGIVIMVFVKRPLLCYIKHVETASFRTGLGGLWGNKGATSIRFVLGDLSLAFVNCHLVPHLENNDKRIQELHDIMTYLIFTGNTKLFDHDVLFLIGDLNFRIEGKEYDEVVQIVSDNQYASLIKKDQLLLEQVKGHKSPSYLCRFMEMQLVFVPSYKYEPGTDHYHDGGKGRAPAWTDRILWCLNPNVLPQMTDTEPKLVIKPVYYGIHMQPRISDHKAVSGQLKALVNLNIIPPVVFRLSEWICSTQGKIEIDIASGTEISSWDWIGLFPEDFVSLDKDYVYWLYTPAVRGVATCMTYYSRPLSGDQVPSSPGRYLLIYKSHQYSCVLGMSPLFQIKFNHQ